MQQTCLIDCLNTVHRPGTYHYILSKCSIGLVSMVQENMKIRYKRIQIHITYDTINDSDCRAVVPGCAMAHPDFGRSVNPISTGGTDYAHLITSGTPGFSDLPTALDCILYLKQGEKKGERNLLQNAFQAYSNYEVGKIPSSSFQSSKCAIFCKVIQHFQHMHQLRTKMLDYSYLKVCQCMLW